MKKERREKREKGEKKKGRKKGEKEIDYVHAFDDSSYSLYTVDHES